MPDMLACSWGFHRELGMEFPGNKCQLKRVLSGWGVAVVCIWDTG